jgi:hypothetical protein
MAWITITENDLLTVLSGPELDAFRATAKADGQADPVAPTITQVIDMVRGYVGGNKINLLGPTGTIPAKLLAPALDIIAVRIPSRVGKAPKSGRKDAADAAVKLLEQVARGAFDIEEPIEPGPDQPSAGRPTFAGRPRRNVRGESHGL